MAKSDDRDTAFGIGFVAGLVIGLFLLIAVEAYLVTTGYALVTCSEEDSCRADYDGQADAWRIIRIENP